MNVLLVFLALSLQLTLGFATQPSYGIMFYNAAHDKCITIESNQVTVKPCDAHLPEQLWQWTPFSQLQNFLTLQCLSAPREANSGDAVKMAECDQQNASQIWKQEEKFITLNDTSLVLNYGDSSPSVLLQATFRGSWSWWEILQDSVESKTVEHYECPKVCQNDGLCVVNKGSYECHCSCNNTGETCEASNWCPEVAFSKVGCLSLISASKPSFLSLTAGALEADACLCAEKVRENGLKYISLGENSCTGYNETEITIANTSPTGCQQQDLSDCDESETLPVCHGRAGYHYVYELLLAEQLRSEEEVRDCADYDYTVRIHDTSKEMYIGPIPDAIPSGLPFSFCIWAKLSKDKVLHRYYNLLSYSIQGSTNYFAFTLRPLFNGDPDGFDIYIFVDDSFKYFRFSYPGGVLNKWLHICSSINVATTVATVYINGEYFATITTSIIKPLVHTGGKLIIGRDQDAYWGGFGTNDVSFGEITLCNIWDGLISEDEVAQIYAGPGTERGNYLAWVDIKKYIHGYAAVRDNPVLKWHGGGCRWVQTESNDDSGLDKGGLFHCPYSNSSTAPHSCISSDVYRTKPCSDHNYYLEFPSTETRARIKLKNFVLFHTWYLTVCVWIKFPPGSENYHSVVFIGVPPTINFHLNLRNDQKSFAIDQMVWSRTETYANNQWFHLCALQDHNDFKMYRNGIDLGPVHHRSTAKPVKGDNEIYIGDSPTIYNTKWSFIGSLAHLNIWDKALDADTIALIADGGQTYVGNLLGWPELAKYAIPGTISVRRPSPLMTWSDPNCHWSKSSCVAGVICNNAKFVCPPLQLNEVSPQSCTVASYDVFQHQDLKPNLVADLKVVARDQTTLTNLGIDYSSIFINDVELKTSSPLKFVVLNALTGSLIKEFGCDDINHPECGTTLNDSLSKIRVERITLMIIKDSSGPYFEPAIPAIRLMFGEELLITRVENLQTVSMLGYNGFNDVSWPESRIVSNQTSVIQKSVPLLRESCLDHLYMGERENGKYVIYPRGGNEITVYCDFTTNGGGWTVIHRRNKGETMFPITANSYDNGFGSVDGEFWLGNKKISRLGEGQLLAVLHEDSSNFGYDLYNYFHIRSNSALDIAERSGITPQAIFDTDGMEPMLFAAPKGSPWPSDCIKSNDGGWWFRRENCEGINLNGERERCDDELLGTEMLFRQRLPSNDIVIKEISMTMTYQDGMDACLNDGLRLCSSMEICRDGKTVTGGSVKNIFWVPVADYYNRWINIGSLDEDRICEIEYNPDWGTNGSFQEYKGSTYCCKHEINSAHEPTMNFPTKVTMASSYSHDQAERTCKEKGQQLCLKSQLCRNGIFVPGVKTGLDKWTPVSDGDNDWIQIGNSLQPECRSHYPAPSWGIITDHFSYKDLDIFCCDITPKARLHSVFMHARYTYTEAVAKCKEMDEQLCLRSEICTVSTPANGIKVGQDKWTPTGDQVNSWIQTGDKLSHPCTVHSPNPVWGSDSSTRNYKDLEIFCCRRSSKGYEAKSKLPVILPLPRDYTYDIAVEKCEEIGYQLCKKSQVCPDNIPVYGVVEGSISWIPIGDEINEWIRIGNVETDVCVLHYPKPTWGHTVAERTLTGDVYCCPTTPEGPWAPTKYAGFEKYTYLDGMEECGKKKQRLCTVKEICPNGIGKDTVFGTINGDYWARVLDRKDEWVNIGNLRPTCVSHSDYLGNFPAWSDDPSSSWSGKTYLVCCPLIYEGRVSRTWKYDLKFHGNLSYVHFSKVTPLPKPTICWWMMLNVLHYKWKTVFSYQPNGTSEHVVEFAVMSGRLFRLTIGNDKRDGTFPTLYVDNHEYHHFCVSWNSYNQEARIFRDGLLLSTFTGITFPSIQPSMGTLVIGQSYTKQSTTIDPDRSFSGIITRFNVWDYELNDYVIKQKSLVCGEEEGNIIAWPEVKLWTFGGVEIIKGDHCFPENCLDYLYRGKLESGIYEVRPLKNQSTIQVYCDQDLGTGSWISIGKVSGGTIRFIFRSYKEFKQGFGDLEQEFWLGHDKIHMLTSAQTQDSLLAGYDEDNNSDISLFGLLYHWFMLGREDDDYRLYFSNPSGTENQLLTDKPFVTEDHDTENLCGQTVGPYWHKDDSSCVQSNLFGGPNINGKKGAQWYGQDQGKVKNWQWKIKSSHAFKTSQPVIYWANIDNSWGSASLFCNSKGALLCHSSSLCSPEKDPFGAQLYKLRRTPVADAYGKWLNIGETSPCSVSSTPGGDNHDKFSYKRRVICCHGYRKRDWRYDLRFLPGSSGHIKISPLTNINEFTICWWLRIPPFEHDYSTIFTIYYEGGPYFKISLTPQGILIGDFNGATESKKIPSTIDGTWHHYCVLKSLNHIYVYFDSEQQFIVPLGIYTNTLVWEQLFIGQTVDIGGTVTPNLGLIGELTRFNMWIRVLKQWEITVMSKKCGGDVGSLLAWPEVKYKIVGDVVYVPRTTCTKPEVHFWPFTEVSGESNAYRDVLNDYDLALYPSPLLVEPGKTLVFPSGQDKFIARFNMPDDCVTDPELCAQTGLTIGLWMKRKGLQSNILPETDAHYLSLMKWLDAATSGVSNWLVCYSHTGSNMDVAAFHAGCDYVGATVTLIKVGDYVFGGFSNQNWGGSARHIPSHSSFLFSIYNPSNIGPVILEVIPNQNGTALYTDDELGPTFGKNYDLKISSTEGSSSLGQTYKRPPGITTGPFFTATQVFTIDQIEVFYAHVPSEAVGIEFPSVIKDEQMTASFYEKTPKYGPQTTRLNSNPLWRSVQYDTSPWIQIKLNDVAKITKIAIRGRSGMWVKKFRLSFSMDASHWYNYKEVLNGNSDDTTIEQITLHDTVAARYVRFIVVEQEGDRASMGIEMYTSDKVCPSTSSGATVCPQTASLASVTEEICNNFGCCFLNLNCYSKQETFTDVGMESGSIPDGSITVSSWIRNYRPYKARFNQKYVGWQSEMTDFPQWLQVELNRDEMLTHVATQSWHLLNGPQYCKLYKIYYRKISDSFAVYMENGYPRIFEGYGETTKIIKHLFLRPFVARFVRLYPQLIPTGLLRIELYRAIKGSRTNIIKTTYANDRRTGISLEQHTLMQYRFAVQTDSAFWELSWEWITYGWTHILFTWSEQLGIHFYENGNFQMQTKEPSEFVEAKFVRYPDKLVLGRNDVNNHPHAFELANLFILKRSVLPYEAKYLVHDVPCSFDDISQCTWNKNTTWRVTDSTTPSLYTGPDDGDIVTTDLRLNLALGKTTSPPVNSSLAVDGFVDTCAVLTTQSEWTVSISEPWRIQSVVILNKPDYDPDKLVVYMVKVQASPSEVAFCYEKNGYDAAMETARTFYCNQTFHVNAAIITAVDASVPLVLCEVAVYPDKNEKYAFLESSYPIEKGFSGILTTSFFSQYNCLRFSYHMYGKNIGRLNVFGPDSDGGNKTLLWRIAGDQGNEWQYGLVKLKHDSSQDFYEVAFEGIVGDGYMSDIALRDVAFTVDSKCETYPSVAAPTISITPPKYECSCLSRGTTDSGTHVTITKCTTISQNMQWNSDGVLKLEGKCLRPATDDVTDGTKLVLSTSCSPTEVAFQLTSTGAVQHMKSLLCIQSVEWWYGIKEGDVLALGRQGCYDVKWSWATILLKVASQTSHSKLNVLKLGTDQISCGDYNGSLMHFIPIDPKTTQPDAFVFRHEKSTDTYVSATVTKLHENNANLFVSWNETHSFSVPAENTTKTPNQPVRGSSIIGRQAVLTRILSEWLAARGIYIEFWRPCVYFTLDGTSKFNCSMEEDVPSLLIIRKKRDLIGGYMDRKTLERKRNFLFSLKQSSSIKFEESSVSVGNNFVLSESGMSFGGDELSITWTGDPEVKNIPGGVFGIPDLDSMIGTQQFTADDFEVLQPKDEICVPRCQVNEVCDQITGKCICDSTGRPPSWCITGAASETIYDDAKFYWSMDVKHNIMSEKVDETAWALVEGDVDQKVGVNGPAVEINGNDKIELLSDEFCFDRPRFCEGKGITISFWLKSLEKEGSSIQDRMFLRTSYDIQSHTGYFMYQGDNPGDVVLIVKALNKECTFNFFIEPNLWTFVTLVKPKSSMIILLNGVNTNSEQVCTDKVNVKNPEGKLILGNGGSDCSVVFDDVAVWFRTLEESEVQKIYRYYYKDPPMLTASLDVKFNTLVWKDELLDKENDTWKGLQNEVYTKFRSLFPGHDNSSFVINTCRNDTNGANSKLVCNVRLALNGSDYETVKILEDKDIIPDIEISNLKTDEVPYNATILDATNPEPSKIILQWTSNTDNLYQGFLVTYLNNKTNETFNATVNKIASTYELYNLTGYSHYIIRFAAYTLAGIGKWSEVIVMTKEDVPKYPPSNLIGHNASSTELFLTWDGVPVENTYKELRGYVVYVVEADTSFFVKNITTNASTLEVLIDDLKKFKTYTIHISAYSIDAGVPSTTLNLTTAEDAPDAPPDDFQVFNSSSRSLRIEFDPVPPDLINGILRGYRVFYWKTREGNDTHKNFTITKEPGSNSVVNTRRRRSVDQYHEGYPLFADIYNLEEYTNYTVQIQALTILDGVMAPPFTALTGEDLPSMAPPNVTARNSSSTSVLLEWDLIPEEDRNGKILGYNVYYIGRNGVEQTFVYESTSTFLDLQGLEKYTDYSFQLTIFNSIGESNRSEIVSCKTDQDRPDLPPQDLTGTPTSPSTMGIVWKPVPFPYGRGIILGYRFVFSTMSGQILVEKVLPPEEDFISVGSLEVFTNYTVNMTAFTIKGDGPWVSKVVLSLQLAPTIPPLNLTAESFSSLSSLPVHWIKVPPELTKGYILGYKLRIQLITVGLEEVPDAKEKEIVLKGQPSSYVFENLDFFSKYRIYLIAYTVNGDSPRSNTIYAETCRCGPLLPTQWRNLAPYTNISNPEYYDEKILKNEWGIFPFIVNDAVRYCCQTCKTHNYSSVSYTHNYHGQPSEVAGNEALVNSIDGLTDLTFPVYGYVGMSLYHSLYKYTPLIESPGSAFLVRKEKSSIGGILMSNILGNWPLAVLMVCLAFASGAIMWLLEMSENSEEFPPKVIKGILNGFWWAYITMTTVGYGDRSPRTKLGRVFAIVWTLMGLVVTGIMVGDLASSLTVSISDVEKIIYGAKVGALDLSPEFRLGVRLNAKMNKVRPYQTLDELYEALLSGEVDGILLDAYVVGSRKDLFKNPDLLVNKIKDYRSAYGIVWAGRSARMKVCLDWYMKTRRSEMFYHVADNLHMVRKIDKIDAQEELANIFDPTTKIYTQTLFLCLVLLGAVVVLGFIYEIIRRRRLATKIKPHGENETKNQNVKEIDECVHKITADIVHRVQKMKTRHMKQLRKLNKKSWFKKSKVRPLNLGQSNEVSIEDIT